MSKTVQDIIDFCDKIVTDDGTRWGDSWVNFVNSGQLLICDIFPAASAVTTSVLLVPGVAQSCPTGATRFLGLTNNRGSAGTTQGNVISVCDEEALGAYRPGWMGDTASTTIENYMFDENEPTNYKVYPPVHASTPVYAGVKYATVPTDCEDQESIIGISDKYFPALCEWCLHLAFIGETDARDPNKAANHLSTFFNLLGIKETNRAKYSPNVQERAGIVPAEAKQ